MIRDGQAEGVVQDQVPWHEVQDNLEVSSRVYFFHNIRVRFVLLFEHTALGRQRRYRCYFLINLRINIKKLINFVVEI